MCNLSDFIFIPTFQKPYDPPKATPHSLHTLQPLQQGKEVLARKTPSFFPVFVQEMEYWCSLFLFSLGGI